MAALPGSESTPPLYYAAAWLWSTVFGTAEVQLRSLSALAGTASNVVIYLGARALPLRRRSALVAAAIVAVSPVLIWFSQDARSYSLAFLLSALSFLFFAKARRGSRRDLLWWAVCSALAIATHYFAGFLVAGETVLLLARRDGRRAASVAVASVATVVAFLMPLAIRQADNAHAGWIAEEAIGQRLERAGAKLVGDDNGNEHQQRQPGPIPLGVPAALAVASLILLLSRGDPSERRSGAVAAAVGAVGVALPLALGLLGADYFNGRNLVPVFVPLIVLIGAGFGVRRAGRLGIAMAGAFCLCSLIFTIEINRLPRLQREDLRNAAQQVGPLRPDKAVVTIRYSANMPLRYYLDAEPARIALPPLREIDLVGSATAAEHNARRLLPPAFRRAESRPVSYNFTLTRYVSTRPQRVPLSLLERGALVGGAPRASVLVSEPH